MGTAGSICVGLQGVSFCRTRDVRTTAFPSISTGAYRFPVEQATKVVLTEVRILPGADPLMEKVMFVCFSKLYHESYKRTVGRKK